MRRAGLCLVVAVVLIATGCVAVPPTSQVASPSRTSSPMPSTAACASIRTPVARSSMVFVYMPDRAQALLFGGRGSDHQPLGDTWLWTAGCWSEVNPAQKPSPRDGAAAAYDPVHSKVLVFGGTSPGVVNSDTWAWDGQTWTQSATGGVRPTLFPGSVAGFDPVSQRVVLFGLMNGGGAGTFTWDGTNWQQLTPASSPEGRDFASMALDPNLNRILLFGGFKSGRLFGDTWTWEGTTWSSRTPAHSPPPRAEASAGSWAAGRVLIVWGGLGGTTNSGMRGDAWAWNGTDWSQLPSPGVRLDAVGIDTGSQLLFFGGAGPAGYHNDTMAWNGTAWSQA
jgi:hypothetical protein